MAKIELNGIFLSIQGRLGDYVFKTSPSGETIISRVPDMSQVKWSKAQKAQRQRMKEANAYAREAMNEPEMRAYYESKAKRLRMTPYNLAISDFFKDPEKVEVIRALRKT